VSNGGGAAAAAPSQDLPPLRPAALTFAPGFHALGGVSPAAAYVVETSQGPLAIDSGLADDAATVLAEMAELGLDPTKLRAVLLTHVHGDHCGGAAKLRALTGAKIHAGEGDAAVLEAGRPREAFTSTFYMPDYAPHPTPVDVVLKGDTTLSFGDVTVRALATPGHTPGSTCYLVERAGRRAFFAGDVIMMLHGDPKAKDDRGRPLGTYSAYLSPRYRGDAKSFPAISATVRTSANDPVVIAKAPIVGPPPRAPRSPPVGNGLEACARWALVASPDGAGPSTGTRRRCGPAAPPRRSRLAVSPLPEGASLSRRRPGE
jgi:glyoxylase-like metal-dependent hydrolase (beta-lactamase superfamily II)